jgi:hypothetical protein
MAISRRGNYGPFDGLPRDCEQLLTQLLGFGAEKHDAVDGLVYLILGLVGDGIEEAKVHYV